MKTNFSSILAISLIGLLVISCESNKKRSSLPIPDDTIKEIVVGMAKEESTITKKSTINEVIRILNNSNSMEMKKEQISESKKVRVQLITSNPKKGQLYLLDKKNGSIEILPKQKKPKYKIDEMQKLNSLLNLK